MRPMSTLAVTAGTAVTMATLLSAQAEGAAGDRHRQTSIVRPVASVSPWLAISPTVPVIGQPDALRVGSSTQVIWSQADGSRYSVRVRTLDAQARPVGPGATVVEGWLAVSRDPKLFLQGTERVAAFAGIRSSAAGDPYVGPMVSARSADGATWALAPGSLTMSTAAGNAQSIDAIDGGGVPFVAFGGFRPAVVLHRGAVTGGVGDPGDFTAAATCCNTEVALARDPGTAAVWVAWHGTGATDPAQAGVQVQRVWPQPAGPAQQAPGSAAAGKSLNPGQPVALAAGTGGVWAAYLLGYPTATTIRLWRVGTTTWRDLPAGGQATTVALSAAPGGRLWLSWLTLGDRVLHAVRTNPAVTRFGAVRRLPQPGGPASQLWATTSEGTAGPLTLIASAQVAGAGQPTLYALRALPGLTLRVRPAKLRDGAVRMTVTDAGSPVRRAAVRFRGKTVRTNAAGRATVRVPASARTGQYPARASKPGYAPARAVVRVR